MHGCWVSGAPATRTPSRKAHVMSISSVDGAAGRCTRCLHREASLDIGRRSFLDLHTRTFAHQMVRAYVTSGRSRTVHDQSRKCSEQSPVRGIKVRAYSHINYVRVEITLSGNTHADMFVSGIRSNNIARSEIIITFGESALMRCSSLAIRFDDIFRPAIAYAHLTQFATRVW